MPTAKIGGYDLRKPVWRPKGWIRIVIVLAVLAFIAYRAWQNQQRPADRPVEPSPVKVDVPAAITPEAGPADDPTPEADAAAPPATGRTAVVANQTIYDQDRQVVFRGDVELGPTLARIDAGDRLRFPNDGATFQNRESRLPKKPAGYYKEYVHPTPGLSGPGPQRIVVGEKGETYYTPDHYRTFQRVDSP